MQMTAAEWIADCHACMSIEKFNTQADPDSKRMTSRIFKLEYNYRRLTFVLYVWIGHSRKQKAGLAFELGHAWHALPHANYSAKRTKNGTRNERMK